MSLVIGDHITHSYGLLHVLQSVSFRLAEGDRVGLVGPNGEGKTTLLRILAGAMEPTEGTVHRARGVCVGYLPQDPPAPRDVTIRQSLEEAFADLGDMERKLHDLAERLETDHSAEALEEYGHLQTAFEDRGGYDRQQRIDAVLTGLHFPADMWDRPLGQLSGGQRTRAFLARLLLERPGLLLLDEPTNHLDIDSVEWLEGYLASFGGTLVVVSHDRYFLDRVTNRTWEVAFGDLDCYKGSYSAWVPQREQRRLEQMRIWTAQQEYIAQTKDFIARHLAGQRTKEAQGRRTRLERFLAEEAIEKPRERDTIHLRLTSHRRSGEIVLTASEIAAGYSADEPLAAAERLELQRGWRVAIVGPNGAGKTTLLRTLLGELPALGGETHRGANVEVGYLSQTHAELDVESTAAEAVAKIGGCLVARARDVLGSLHISGEMADRKVSELSGGQRSRVVLATLMVQQSNLLMLDEPTNHLDIPSTEILQESLSRFEGTVLFVSHDRYLIQHAATHIWAIVPKPDGPAEVKVLLGGWDDYVRWRADQAAGGSAGAAGKAREKKQVDRAAVKRQANQLKNLRKQHETLEAEIDAVETELAELQDQISVAGESGDVETISQLGETYNQRNARLAELWAEWEHVGEQIESAE